MKPDFTISFRGNFGESTMDSPLLPIINLEVKNDFGDRLTYFEKISIMVQLLEATFAMLKGEK